MSTPAVKYVYVMVGSPAVPPLSVKYFYAYLDTPKEARLKNIYVQLENAPVAPLRLKNIYMELSPLVTPEIAIAGVQFWSNGLPMAGLKPVTGKA